MKKKMIPRLSKVAGAFTIFAKVRRPELIRPGKLAVFAFSDIHSPDSFSLAPIEKGSYDLVFTLGDISPATLEYINYMSRVETYGVPGNHDPAEVAGLNNIHGIVVEYKGISIGGFGGAIRYKEGPHQYSEKEVAKRMKKMPRVDIFISHAPPFCTSDKSDFVHTGFKAFDEYIATKKPRYWLHGHNNVRHRTQIGETTVIGIVEKEPLVLRFD